MDPEGVFDIGKRNYLAMRKILWKAGILLHGEAVGRRPFAHRAAGDRQRQVLAAGRRRPEGTGPRDIPQKGGNTWHIAS